MSRPVHESASDPSDRAEHFLKMTGILLHTSLLELSILVLCPLRDTCIGGAHCLCSKSHLAKSMLKQHELQ